MNQPWIYMCSPSRSPLPPPSPSHPSGSPQCTSPEHLSHASNLGWRSISHLIVYLFQCYSLRTSHPRLLPQSPKVCSIHLCLFFCFTYRVIVTIFFLNPRSEPARLLSTGTPAEAPQPPPSASTFSFLPCFLCRASCLCSAPLRDFIITLEPTVLCLPSFFSWDERWDVYFSFTPSESSFTW